jgi:uncharacterized membrane protein
VNRSKKSALLVTGKKQRGKSYEMNEEDSQPMNRLLSIDVLRGFALMGMVMVHFMIYFGDSAAAKTWPYFFLNHVLGDWGAASFLMMMGMSQVFSAKKRAFPTVDLLKKALIRGGYIFLIGILMLALTWGPGEIWQWDILTLMGAMTVILFFCRFMPSWLILIVSLLIAGATPFLRMDIDFTSVWGGSFVPVPVISQYMPGILIDPVSDFKVIWTLQDILLGFLFTGYFPFLPWALFPLVGFVLGRRIVSGQIRNDLPFLGIIGGLLICLSLGGSYASLFRPGSSIISDYLSPLSIFPDSFTMINLQLGMSLLVFSSLYFFYDLRTPDPSQVGFFVGLYTRSSRFSLTLYFLHYLLIGWPLAIVSRISGRDSISALMGAYPALAAGLAGLVFLEMLLFLWEKHGSNYSLEWCLKAITARLMKT